MEWNKFNPFYSIDWLVDYESIVEPNPNNQFVVKSVPCRIMTWMIGVLISNYL